MKKKQSSIDWLIEQLEGENNRIAMVVGIKKYNSIVKEAKAMHKEEIVEAVYDSMGTSFDPSVGRAELYYKEKYENGYK